MTCSFWNFETATEASSSQKLLNKNPNIIYLIQDYDAAYFPHGAKFVAAIQSYDLPHYAILSTIILRGYFREKKLGVYKNTKTIAEVWVI